LLSAGSLALRLPAETREEFLIKYRTNLFFAHGSVLKEYVEVPESLFKNSFELLRYLDRSYEYAQGMKPKARRNDAGGKKKRAAK
jgi:TfoX/Sxy family transcriptional regulator of competence genes